MSILINKDTKVLVQGITGRDGQFHTQRMINFGTKILAGVTPGKGGQKIEFQNSEPIPVFNSIYEAKRYFEFDASIIFVPAVFATDAIYEAIDENIPLIVVITEGVPVHDMMKINAYLKNKKSKLLGPNCPGILVPEEVKIGIIPHEYFKRGVIGVVSRSGTLTYEISYHISQTKYGLSTIVGIGGDPIKGMDFVDILKLFNKDEETKAIVIIGEIGGLDEEEAAKFVKRNIKKPVFGFIAGKTAPPEKRMGHAGAIIEQGRGTAQSKIEAFMSAGIEVFEEPQEIINLLEKINL